ncbi:hypothetical protein H9Q13_02120 [Pontibacter sp. JH31]|uniref:Uncharacterized protein n=1 Tax=Pontibacter aquaedesilientis TaxID=2766980 RepID=A0ABR7XCB8_9BACT|nr:hypothetical protein [Pontibacter aquaedesilientis]MBD1395948.1 hypothetical protein [Pontibacter aquaedesilientis]
MKNEDLEQWDEDRYKELNTYFKVKIQGMINADPYIQELIKQENGLQLQDLIDRMSERDQLLWTEFIRLDRIKLHIDMQNHLEGRGTPYSPQRGFGGVSNDSGNEDLPW